jgi:ribosomal protein S18 acetylase RimI-like enzyme
MKLNIENIVEIDALNMTPYFEMEGLQFNEKKRKKSIISRIDNGAQIATVVVNNRIVAYFEFDSIGSKVCKICSIQVHPEYQDKFVLRKLLKKTYYLVKESKYDNFLSATHASNTKSIKFHKRIGFSTIYQDPNKILFKISSHKLKNNLCRFL